jgi:hypothetical protein
MIHGVAGERNPAKVRERRGRGGRSGRGDGGIDNRIFVEIAVQPTGSFR